MSEYGKIVSLAPVSRRPFVLKDWVAPQIVIGTTGLSTNGEGSAKEGNPITRS